MNENIAAFRAEIAEFCAKEMPPSLRHKVRNNLQLAKADYVDWQRRLRARGWFGGHWPERYGGLGWGKLKHWVFEDELARQGGPWLIPFGVTYVGPVIYTFGSEEQKDRFLRPILESQVWWAQGYSEPDAGSDLANLRTTAVADGDSYILNGQKIWTTLAQHADYAFVLVRTANSGKPQEGISFLLVDLSSPGISVRPIASIDRCHHLNEVFFDEVRVPAANLVGEEGKGWRYAKFLLAQERLLVAEVGKARRLVDELLELARRVGPAPGLAADKAWRQELTLGEIDIAGLEALCLDLLAQAESGSEPGPEASLLKIVGSELAQRLNGMALDLVARFGLPYHVPALSGGEPDIQFEGGAGIIREYLHGRASTIYGGSNEIQRNIIAKSVLGL